MIQLGKWAGSFADKQDSCMNRVSFPPFFIITAALQLYYYNKNIAQFLFNANVHLLTCCFYPPSSPTLSKSKCTCFWTRGSYSNSQVGSSFKDVLLWSTWSQKNFFTMFGWSGFISWEAQQACVRSDRRIENRVDSHKHKALTQGEQHVEKECVFYSFEKKASFPLPSVGNCCALDITHVRKRDYGSYVSSGS